MSSVDDLQFADGDTGGLASPVRLADFREFADAKGLQVPDGFPPAARSAQPTKPLTEKERTTLLAIIGGIAMATDFDISQPTPAATKICKVFEENGMKIGQRTVEEWLKRVNAALDKKSR